MRLTEIAAELSRAVGTLRFDAPVVQVYNPLDYAWAAHREYLERHGAGPKGRVLLLGMNPGPWGMAQTGVPFGDVVMVRDWMGIEAPVKAPAQVHPKRPVQGFGCTRREVSGTRLWGWARERFGAPETFFSRFFVWNYCPLCFMEASGRNFTPDKLPAQARAALFAPCDAALCHTVRALAPRLVVGVGKFAEGRALAALAASGIPVAPAPHPSPANPAANRGWGPAFVRALRAAGVSGLS